MVYNLSSIVTNSTGPLGFVQGVNSVLMGGILGLLILIGVSIVILTSFIFVTKDSARSIAATAFITFTLAILLRAMSLLGDTALFATLIICGGAIAIIKKGE